MNDIARPSSTRKLAALLFLGGALLAAGGIAVVQSRDDSAGAAEASPRLTGEHAQRADSVFKVREPGTHCAGAIPLQTRKDFPSDQVVFVPKSATFDDAWLCGHDVFIKFGTVEASYTDGGETAQPGDVWAEMAKQWGGSVIDVQGRSAYLDPGKADDTNYVYPELLMIVDGRQITLLGDRSSKPDDLVKLANSLALPPTK